MKYKLTNKTFSPLQLSGIGVVPARGSIIVDVISKGLKDLEKNNKLSIRECKER